MIEWYVKLHIQLVGQILMFRNVSMENAVVKVFLKVINSFSVLEWNDPLKHLQSQVSQIAQRIN